MPVGGPFAPSGKHFVLGDTNCPGNKRTLLVVAVEIADELDGHLLQHVLSLIGVANECADERGNVRLGGGPQLGEAFGIFR